jgi:uncharacterized protein (TIGR01777 family)
MKILMTGGTGFIGTHLIRHFQKQGADITLVSRSQEYEKDAKLRFLTWSQLQSHVSELEGLDAIINLAGETINQRWTDEAKRKILNSRTETTAQIAKLVDRLDHKPRVVINGSAVAIYGTSETETFTEESEKQNSDFLAGVVEQWEKEVDHIQGTRLVKLRTGVVLGMDGGAFPQMILPYRLMAGGRVGSGQQWFSWIHVEDMVRIVEYCMMKEEIEGAVNCTSPEPVRNDRFGCVVGKVLRRPHWLPIPSFIFKLIFGEMAILLLEGQKVMPKKLKKAGFTFRFPQLESAIRDLYRK